ncbi:MAG TPA: hypothetical protein VEA69_04090, partial [Tepidisphaeraceae bacterium]|nr:hypothetical protein [Tepidisphaeraceae bacterium]
LKRWRGPYPEDVFIAQFEKVADGFAKAEHHLIEAVDKGHHTGGPVSAHRELDVARAARVHLASVAHQARFIRARDALDKAAPEQRPTLVAEMRNALGAEAALAKELYGLQRRDSRIGFEASNHYFYLGQDLVEKAINCAWLAARWR